MGDRVFLLYFWGGYFWGRVSLFSILPWCGRIRNVACFIDLHSDITLACYRLLRVLRHFGLFFCSFRWYLFMLEENFPTCGWCSVLRFWGGDFVEHPENENFAFGRWIFGVFFLGVVVLGLGFPGVGVKVPPSSFCGCNLRISLCFR